MKTPVFIALLSLIGVGWALPAAAEDDVTIPKSRLQELEQKERELDRLKGGPTTTNSENARLKKEEEKTAAKPQVAAEPEVTHVSPPIASLPALNETEEVDAMDLANYYRADSAVADQRFLKRKFLLRGEIVGFEKPLLKRDYKVLLKTADRDTRVICNFYPPEQFQAVFTTHHGSQLVGTMGDTRVPLAKVGQTVVLRAECRGWKDSCVLISGGGLKAVPAPKTN